MDQDLSSRAKNPAVAGTYVTSVVAYFLACLVSMAGITAMSPLGMDIATIAGLAAITALLALIPFCVVKFVMARNGWEGVAAHGFGGAIAALAALMLLGRWNVLGPTVILSFLFWGGTAGLVYLGARDLGRRIYKGAAA